MNTDIKEYYAQRAREYEEIYRRPERRDDLVLMEREAAALFAGRDVLEIACGTGYWTRFIARSARSVVAVDCNRHVLSVAREKKYGGRPVLFLESDAYSLSNVEGLFSGAFLGFWWSHIPKSKLGAFLETLHSRLADDARVAVFDNSYVEGNSTPISRTDAEGNTYQLRELKDGSSHEVLKNFPGENDLREELDGHARCFLFKQWTYYWMAQYTVKRRN
jgi:demethylmenaquinone methyltransferase/2-methoxy-6-polyprenyl-1,4-benzoquinol methylase